MADTPDITACADTSAGRDDFRNPFFALHYHFGMLLGVDDFETEQALPPRQDAAAQRLAAPRRRRLGLRRAPRSEPTARSA